MPEPIENLYFNWLRAKVLDINAPSYLYLDLLKILYRTEFVWRLIGDKNREDDGLELRIHFLRESGLELDDTYWFDSPCSVLEVLIAFSNRASFDTEIPASDWFWQFLSNLGLDHYTQVSSSDEDHIDQILETFLFRTYDHSGRGGLFPLNEPTEDQTRLEIWFQFNRYIAEQGL